MDSIKQALTKVKQSFGSRDDLNEDYAVEDNGFEKSLEKSTFVDIDIAADRNLEAIYVYDDVFSQEDSFLLKTKEEHLYLEDSLPMDGPSTSEMFVERIEPHMRSLQKSEITLPRFADISDQKGDDYQGTNYIYEENKYKETRKEMHKSITSTIHDSMANRDESSYDTMGFYFTGQKYFREVNGKYDKIETRSYQMKSLLSMQCSDTQTPVVHGPPKIKCRLEDSVVRMEIVPLVGNTKTINNSSNKSTVSMKDESDQRRRHDIQYVVYPWKGVAFEKPTVRPPCRIHVAVK